MNPPWPGRPRWNGSSPWVDAPEDFLTSDDWWFRPVDLRLGPAEEEYRALPPPRRLYIDAFARALKQTKQPSQSALTMQRTVRRVVGERVGISPDAPDEAFINGGIRLGLPEAEITAAIQPVETERQFVLAARAYTRLNGEGAFS